MIEFDRSNPNYAWKSADISQNENQWKFSLDDNNVDVMREFMSDSWNTSRFDNLVNHQRCLSSQHIPILAAVIGALRDRFGFAVVKNVPVDFPAEQLGSLLMAIGNSIGSLMPQNVQGELLSLVTDRSSGDTSIRGYQSNLALPFHSDTADILALLCVRPAKQGGLNALVNSNTIYEELCKNHPQHISLLERGFRYTYPESKHKKTDYIPVFSRSQGIRSCRYLRSFIELNSTLTDSESAALDAFDSTATSPENTLALGMEPGDLLFVNNYTLLHSRTGFQDHSVVDERRMLQRLWINMENFRPLHPELEALSRRFC